MDNQSLNSLWSVTSGCDVLCVGSDDSGKQIAVGTDTTCLALDAQSGRRDFSSDSQHGERVTAVAFGSDGRLLVGGHGILRLWDIREATVLASRLLREDVQAAEDTVFLSPRPDGSLFGVASENGRKILLVNGDLEVQTELSLQPNCGPLTELSWLSDSTLLATSQTCLQCWQCTGNSSQPCLVLGKSIGLVSATASPDKSTLAAGSRDGVVYLWSLTEGDEEAGEDALSAELRSTLKDYRQEVRILCWERSGRFLASVDGAEATVWEVPKLFKETIQSTVCCGHDSSSQVLCAAFQKDGPMLATGGSDGKVLFHNSDHFKSGAHSYPCAAAQMIPSADSVVCLTWLPGGRLVAGTKSGKVVGWQLQPTAFEEATPTSIPTPVPAAEEAVEQDPPAPSDATLPKVEPPLPSPSGHKGPNGFSKSRSEFAAAAAKGLPPDRAGSSGTNGIEQAGRQNSRGRGPPPINVRDQQGLSAGRQMSMPERDTHERDASDRMRADLRANIAKGAESGQPAPPSQPLGERSRSLQDNSARRSGSLERQQPSLSPSLLSHIQRVQQKPAANNRRPEPAGWGMGSPSAPPTSQQQLAVHQMGGGMPLNPMASPQQMAPGYMMYANHNQAMAAQHHAMMYGYPPGVTPVPMMAHPRAAQHGMVEGAIPPGMVYMPPMGPHGQQWPMMSPWMGMPYYHLAPGQPGLGDHMNLGVAGRSTSAPDGRVPAGHNLASPLPSSGLANSTQRTREDLGKNSISLPHTVGREWRSSRPQGNKAEDPPSAAGPSSEPSSTGGPLRTRGSNSSSDLANANSRDSGDLPRRGSRGEKLPKVEERKEQGGEEAEMEEVVLPPPPSNGFSALGMPLTPGDYAYDFEGRPLDLSTPIVTVYVGNLAPTVDEAALGSAFNMFGPIANIQVIRDRNSMRSRGFAFISYTQPQFAAAAMQQMNGVALQGAFRGRTLKVGPSNRVI